MDVKVTSATWKIVGIAINAKTNPPDNIHQPNFRNTTKNAKPNKPNTIDGIEANVSDPKRINLIIFWFDAYSDM